MKQRMITIVKGVQYWEVLLRLHGDHQQSINHLEIKRSPLMNKLEMPVV